MDFSYLLEIAKMNDQNKKKDDDKFFPSKISRAKKVERPVPNSDAVKALLNQKEEDLRQKKLQYIEDRKKLVERRSLDKKNNRKILAMINRTKGANKSVLEEAKDLMVVNGEEQCDTDDYGYESARSQQIFQKLTNGYRETKDNDRLKFKKTVKGDIKDIKNRVMDSLKRKYEEDTGIRKRTRTRKSKTAKETDQFINDGDPYGKAGSSTTVEYPRHTVKVVEEVIPPIKKIKKSMPPPMSFQDILKVAKTKQHDPFPVAPKVETLPTEADERPLTGKEKAEKESERLRKLRRTWKLPAEPSSDVPKVNLENSAKVTNLLKKTNCNLAKEPIKESKVLDRSKYFAVAGATPARKESISTKLRTPSVQPGISRKLGNPPMRNNRIDSDDDEYDSEMDDFIDDGGDDMDVSSEIKKIFRYDKSKYSKIDDDDDDTSMEASYSQLQREEQISAKIGLREDMEDMKQEEIDKKNKIIKRKKFEQALRRK